MEDKDPSWPFAIEFYLLDMGIDKLRPHQEEGYMRLTDKLKEITSKAVRDLGKDYCTLDHRVAAVIASADSTKQLRGSWPDYVYKKGQLNFRQSHLTSTDYFTLAEVIRIAKAICLHIEIQVQYDVRWRIVLDVEPAARAHAEADEDNY